MWLDFALSSRTNLRFLKITSFLLFASSPQPLNMASTVKYAENVSLVRAIRRELRSATKNYKVSAGQASREPRDSTFDRSEEQSKFQNSNLATFLAEK